MLPPDLLNALRCPKQLQQLSPADPKLIAHLNKLIAEGRLKTDPMEAGLLRADGQVLYPIRNGIPILLLEAGIDLASLK